MNNDIWNNLFPSSDISTLIFMLFVFFISGIVKGFLGIGLPAAAMALLTLVIPPAHTQSLYLLFLYYLQISLNSLVLNIGWKQSKLIGCLLLQS